MFGLMILIMMELHERFMKEGEPLEMLDGKMFNAGLHSLQMIIVWIRFMSVLITSKSMGPFLRMIYLMIK